MQWFRAWPILVPLQLQDLLRVACQFPAQNAKEEGSHRLSHYRGHWASDETVPAQVRSWDYSAWNPCHKLSTPQIPSWDYFLLLHEQGHHQFGNPLREGRLRSWRTGADGHGSRQHQLHGRHLDHQHQCGEQGHHEVQRVEHCRPVRHREQIYQWTASWPESSGTYFIMQQNSAIREAFNLQSNREIKPTCSGKLLSNSYSLSVSMNHDISCDCCSNRVGVSLPIVQYC